MTIVDNKLLLARDHSSILEWCIEKIPKITDDWTDFQITDPGILLLNCIGYVYDGLHYTLDHKYLNNQIRYSRSLNSLINMCNLMGVDLPSYNSSLTVLEIIVNHDKEIPISPSTLFESYDRSSGKSITLVPLVSTNLVRGINQISLIEGEPHEMTLHASDFSNINTYIIEETNVAINSVEITVVSENWKRVSDAFLTTDLQNVFSVHRWLDGYTLLKMMPGFRDIVGSNDIKVKYNITNGSLGNLGNNTEIFPKSKIFDVLGNDVSDKISIRVVYSGGGTDSSNLEDTRCLLGTTASVVETLVNPSDYKAVADKINHVEKIVVGDLSDKKVIYYVPELNYPDLNELENAIDEYISIRVPAFTEYEIRPIQIRQIGIDMTVYLNRNELNLTSIDTKIRQYLNNIFSRSNQDPGYEFERLSLTLQLETLSPSIDHIVITNPISDFTCLWYEIIELVEVRISFDRG